MYYECSAHEKHQNFSFTCVTKAYSAKTKDGKLKLKKK